MNGHFPGSARDLRSIDKVEVVHPLKCLRTGLSRYVHHENVFVGERIELGAKAFMIIRDDIVVLHEIADRLLTDRGIGVDRAQDAQVYPGNAIGVDRANFHLELHFGHRVLVLLCGRIESEYDESVFVG
jgi:hypothetical protein